VARRRQRKASGMTLFVTDVLNERRKARAHLNAVAAREAHIKASDAGHVVRDGIGGDPEPDLTPNAQEPRSLYELPGSPKRHRGRVVAGLGWAS
jgi:hypothetical protein